MKQYFTFFYLISLLLLSSCATPPVEEFTMKHAIAINDDGSPYALTIKTATDIIPENQYVYSNHVNSIINSIKKSGKTNILIFVFGGMNSLDATLKKSYILANAITNTSDYYPILINWESSLFDAYYEHLMWNRRGLDSVYLGPPLAPFYFIADIGRAISRLPVNLVFQTISVTKDYDMNSEIDESEKVSIDKLKLRVYSGKDYTPGYLYFFKFLVYTCGFPIRLITTPMIDACGKSAWDIMVKRTRTAFQKQQENEVSINKKTKQIIFLPPNGAFALLMDALKKLHDEDNKYFFTLIGHSLGPVMLNEMIRRYPNLPYRNIVYLAAACTIRDTRYALAPYANTHTNFTFYNLCIHENADRYDMMWFAALPRGSILEWIDSFLGDPLTYDDRTLGKWSNSLRVLQSIEPKFRSKVVIKAFGLYDPKTNNIILDEPQQHTDFSDPRLQFWNPAFWQVKTLIKK